MLRQEVRLDGDFDLAGHGAVHVIPSSKRRPSKIHRHVIENRRWNQSLRRPSATLFERGKTVVST
jgi:hypothetical protein